MERGSGLVLVMEVRGWSVDGRCYGVRWKDVLCVGVSLCLFFFFKQKTAYEILA